LSFIRFQVAFFSSVKLSASVENFLFPSTYIYIFFVAQFCLADGTGSCQGAAANRKEKQPEKIESFDL